MLMFCFHNLNLKNMDYKLFLRPLMPYILEILHLRNLMIITMELNFLILFNSYLIYFIYAIHLIHLQMKLIKQLMV